MSKIIQLDDIVVNRIAAGEVVTRPSSVAKELIENSIDAGSSYITIEIEKGGIDLIRISDNGSGIEKEDVKTAFLKHATSKIQSAEQLDKIQSLGFRGEALPSIASVSEVELTTRSENTESGVFFHIRAGKVLEEKPIGCPEGTSISVKNLFFNTPARLKFLKSSGVEASYISDVVSRYIMAHPEISFKYIVNGKLTYHSTGNGDLKTAMYTVYGKEINTDTLELNYEEDGLKIHGIIGMPSISKQNRRYESVFVNGRYVENNTISLAVKDAMETLLMVKRFPLFAFSILVPYDTVDVNVHPAKLIIKFKDERHIYDVVLKEVRELFIPTKKEIIKPIEEYSDFSVANEVISEKAEISPKFVYPENKEVFKPSITEIQTDNKFKNTINEYRDEDSYKYSELKNSSISESAPIKQVIVNSNIAQQMRVEETYEFKSLQSAKLGDVIDFKIIGQVFNTYIIIQADDNMLIIDQHAAHERINYDKFKKSIEKQENISQQLLVPYILEVSHTEKVLIDENIDLFREIGFEIDEMGERSFRIGAVPFILGEPQLKECFDEMLESLFGFKKITNYEIKKDQLITASCKSSIKGGDKLDKSEIETLIRHYKENNVTLTCPHGRPIINQITKHDLEKMFKRIV